MSMFASLSRGVALSLVEKSFIQSNLVEEVCTPIPGCFLMSNGQKRVHPEGTRPKPGTLVAASRMAPSHWPTTALPRSWPHFKRVHPILATHPPTATRFQSRLPDYGQATRPAAHSRTRLQQPRLASRVIVCTVFCSRRGILGRVALHHMYQLRRTGCAVAC